MVLYYILLTLIWLVRKVKIPNQRVTLGRASCMGMSQKLARNAAPKTTHADAETLQHYGGWANSQFYSFTGRAWVHAHDICSWHVLLKYGRSFGHALSLLHWDARARTRWDKVRSETIRKNFITLLVRLKPVFLNKIWAPGGINIKRAEGCDSTLGVSVSAMRLVVLRLILVFDWLKTGDWNDLPGTCAEKLVLQFKKLLSILWGWLWPYKSYCI